MKWGANIYQRPFHQEKWEKESIIKNHPIIEWIAHVEDDIIYFMSFAYHTSSKWKLLSCEALISKKLFHNRYL